MASNKSIYDLQNITNSIYISSYYEYYYLAFDMQFHTHETVEIMYVTFGKLTIQYYDKSDNLHTINIHPNEFVFIDFNVKHKIIVNGFATKILNLEFYFEDNNVATQNSFLTYPPFKELIKSDQEVFKASDNGLLLENIFLIQQYLEKTKHLNKSDERIKLMINLFFMSLADCAKKERGHHLGSKKINVVIEFIQENYANKITLDDISKNCQISKNHLNNLFKKQFQTNIMDYVNEYRIKRACELISETSLTLKDIYSRVGYSNKMCFNRNFKKVVNMTPLEFKSLSNKKSHQVSLNKNITNIYNLEGDQNE